MNAKKIIVVGSANADLVTRVPRCPVPGESLLGHSFQTIPGGKGANQAVGAARLGAETHMVGCVGKDALGEMLRASLREAGVDTTQLLTHPSAATGTAVIFVEEGSGQNAIVVTPSANSGLRPADIQALEALFRGADAVLLQLEIPLETVAAALDLARKHGVLSVLDAGPAQAVSPELLRRADIVSPNETEAEAITGMRVDSREAAERAAARLREMGARACAMKLGAQGSLWLGDEAPVFASAFRIAPVDTVAAGDAFTAALACVWGERSPAESLRFANAAGACSALVAGAQPSMPTRARVEDFLREQGV